MFGFRTPARKNTEERMEDTSPSQTRRAGPSPTHQTPPKPAVRKSIGERESGKPEPRPGCSSNRTPPSTSRNDVNPPPRPKKTTSAVRALAVAETPLLQTGGLSSARLKEAKESLIRGKTHLGNSRNLKTDLKEGIAREFDRLYQLIKDAEAEIRAERPRSEEEKEERQDKDKKEEKNEAERNTLERKLIEKLEEHAKLLEESKKEMEELRTEIRKQEESRPTYASVAAASETRHQQEGTALHSVVVASRDENETGEAVIEQIRKAVNATDGWVTVERIRKARDRKVIVGCKTKEDRRRVQERLKKVEDRLLVEEVKNKDPMVILRGVLACNSDEEILTALRNQNGSVFHGLEQEEDRAEIKYRRKARNPHISHVVMRVSPVIWQRLMERKTVHIDVKKVWVEDQSPLVQCSLCLGYGHGKRFCKETQESCSHCGGPHKRAQCADWMAGVEPSCLNCAAARIESGAHNAFSDLCPIRKKWDSIARSTVAYC
ncbi:hypothetical protein ABMA28_012431 [Loxostege sticticalis]|uniref:Gag-like protein n=1 Tax=Loxostege sticticalis TaxID=481309 RepID=A0ABD0S3U6_LOXSC